MAATIAGPRTPLARTKFLDALAEIRSGERSDTLAPASEARVIGGERRSVWDRGMDLGVALGGPRLVALGAVLTVRGPHRAWYGLPPPS